MIATRIGRTAHIPSSYQRRWLTGAGAALLVALAGCRDQTETTTAPAAAGEVVVYAALDREFSEPILNDFTVRTGIKVLAVYDVESTKTVGLANKIRNEAGRPRCDVFWNNEILNTLRLKSEGLLQPCRPAEAENYPAEFRDPEGYWYGFAARARVLLVNTDLVPAAKMPGSIRDLADPQWRGKVGIAKPLFGTTASHMACLFAKLGDEPAKGLLASFKANKIQVLGGNKACAELVGRGELAFAITDTDDAMAEVDGGRPVRIVFPDGIENAKTASAPANEALGTLLLPNTLAVVKGAPHPEAAAKLIDYLLSAEVEGRLATGASAQIPLHRRTTAVSRACGSPAALRTMRVEFSAAARKFDEAAKFIEREFLK